MFVDRYILLILLVLFVSNTIYGLASPFLPKELEDKDIAHVWTGIIFSSYAVASILVSILTGSLLDKISHKKIITFGTFLMSVSITCFGLIAELDDESEIIVISIVLRIG